MRPAQSSTGGRDGRLTWPAGLCPVAALGHREVPTRPHQSRWADAGFEFRVEVRAASADEAVWMGWG
jgi:hypothetical protein